MAGVGRGAHVLDGQHIVTLLAGDLAVGQVQREALAVQAWRLATEVLFDVVLLAFDVGDQAVVHAEELAAQLQGAAQLDVAGQGGACGNLVEQGQCVLLLFLQLLFTGQLTGAPQGIDQLAQAGQQRLQLFDLLLLVAALAVGQAKHAGHLLADAHRQAEEGIQGRVPRRRAGAGRMLRRAVAEQGFATAQDLTEQGVQVAEFHALGCVFGVEAAAVVIPGDVADGKGAQEGHALFIVEHLTEKAEATAGEVENLLQQVIEQLAVVLCGDEGRLRLLHQFEQVTAFLTLLVLCTQLALLAVEALLENPQQHQQQALRAQPGEQPVQQVLIVLALVTGQHLLHRVGNGQHRLATGAGVCDRQQHQTALLPWQFQLQLPGLCDLSGQPALLQAFLPLAVGLCQRLPRVAVAQRRVLLALQQECRGAQCLLKDGYRWQRCPGHFQYRQRRRVAILAAHRDQAVQQQPLLGLMQAGAALPLAEYLGQQSCAGVAEVAVTLIRLFAQEFGTRLAVQYQLIEFQAVEGAQGGLQVMVQLLAQCRLRGAARRRGAGKQLLQMRITGQLLADAFDGGVAARQGGPENALVARQLLIQ